MLSPEEEAGIEAALDSYRAGRVVDAERAREIMPPPIDRAAFAHAAAVPFGRDDGGVVCEAIAALRSEAPPTSNRVGCR